VFINVRLIVAAIKNSRNTTDSDMQDPYTGLSIAPYDLWYGIISHDYCQRNKSAAGASQLLPSRESGLVNWATSALGWKFL
jgi:hypothetical protein